MRQVVVGTYELAGERIQVVLREGTGGDYDTLPGNVGMARIRVGADVDNWWECIETLLHEPGELTQARMGCRYRPCPDYAWDNGSYLFVLTHTQWSELTARVARLLAACLPDLAKAWEKWKKEEKKRKE